jgi:transporter family protein
MMAVVTAFLWYPVRKKTTPFRWKWAIPLISLFLCGADYVYMEALSQPDALIAVVSMIRRGSVLVSFAIGAWILKEKNLKAKALDLGLLLLSMVFLYLGSR